MLEEYLHGGAVRYDGKAISVSERHSSSIRSVPRFTWPDSRATRWFVRQSPNVATFRSLPSVEFDCAHGRDRRSAPSRQSAYRRQQLLRAVRGTTIGLRQRRQGTGAACRRGCALCPADSDGDAKHARAARQCIPAGDAGTGRAGRGGDRRPSRDGRRGALRRETCRRGGCNATHAHQLFHDTTCRATVPHTPFHGALWC